MTTRDTTIDARRCLTFGPPRLSTPLRLATAPVAVLLALFAQWALLPPPSVAPFAFFFLAVVLAAFLAGRSIGLITVLLSGTVADYFLISPVKSFGTDSGSAVEVPIFVVIASAVAVLTGSLRSAIERANASAVALRASEARLQKVVAAPTVGVLFFGLDGTIHEANDTFERMSGYSTEELRGTAHWKALTAPEFWDVTARTAEGLATRGEVAPYEKQMVRKDGSRWWGLFAPTRLSGSGSSAQCVEFIVDITERKRAEEALRLSQSQLEAERARLKAAVDTLPVGFFAIDERGEMTLVNDAMKRTWAADMPLHCPVDYSRYRAFWPDNGERLSADDWPCAQALRGKRVDNVIIDIERFDGSRGTTLVSSAPIRDESGRVVGAVASNQDITELRAVQAKLQEADRRKNEFLAMLSHELRNPLAPIKNSLYILDRSAPGGQQAKRAQEVIGRQVQHLTRLVDDLLDVTRISRGKIRLQKERLELCDLVRRTAEDHRSVFKAAEIELRVGICEGPLHVEGDPTRLAQAIGNLLGNAVKFTPRGGWVELRVSAENGRACVHVRDNGTGIAANVLNELFEPFVQADATLDRSKGGLGLGLALVKGLVELHGGNVAARSEGAGKGAEFVLNLPLEKEGARAAHRTVRAPNVVTSSLRVLLIEDNVDAAETLKAALELNGHQVETAATGQVGIEKARSFHPDVVLCDIGLPEMDGFEVARRMKADPELKTAPLVALSGYAAPEDLERSKEAGFDRHLAKPPDLGTLENTLSQVSAAVREREGAVSRA